MWVGVDSQSAMVSCDSCGGTTKPFLSIWRALRASLLRFCTVLRICRFVKGLRMCVCGLGIGGGSLSVCVCSLDACVSVCVSVCVCSLDA